MGDSKIGVLIIGAITVGIGAMGILSGIGYLPHGRVDPTVPQADQQAVAICAGVVFAAGGLSAMLSAFPGRAARIAYNLLGLVVAVGLTSLFAWVAIGPGSRGFVSPLAIFGPHVNEIAGRVLFGVAALMGLLIAVFMVRGVGRARSSAN
jgi:hypothetical protein